MSTIKILIVEDEELYATEVEMLVYRLGYETVHATANSEDALHMVDVMDPDLIIMDINIEGELNGVEVAERIKDREIPILFITSLKDKDLYERAMKTSYVGYLIKPFDELTLQSAIEFAIHSLAEKEVEQAAFKGWKDDLVVKNCFLIKKQTSLLKLLVKDIVYIESHGNYCMIYTNRQEKHFINLSLIKIHKKLLPNQFIRIHKRYLLQFDLIEQITLGGNEITAAGGTKLPVGRTYRGELLKQFNILK